MENKPTTQKHFTLKSGKTYYVGQIFINRRNDYLRISEYNPEKENIHFECFNGEKWVRYGSDNIERIESDNWIPLEGSMEDELEKAIAILKDIPSFQEDEKVSDEMTLVVSSTKDNVTMIMERLEEKKILIERAERVIKAETDKLNSIISSMESKIGYLSRIVALFEFYLGVYEEITQIAEGEPAGSNEIIHIRQLILFMDEEFGDPRPNKRSGQPGLDFSCVEDFDGWISKPDNLNLCAPESKCIVAIKPSRQDRTYSENPWINSMMKNKNRMTYLLIRNGENLYRIWTSVNVGDLLFPTSDETESIFRVINEDSKWGRERGDSKKYIYIRNAMMLQGLFDRTEVLNPIPHRIDLLNMEKEEPLVKFIRDAEDLLPTGRPSFWDWLRDINEKLKRGSRVFMDIHAPNDRYYDNKSFRNRYLRWYADGRRPPLPEPGIYQLDLTPDIIAHIYVGDVDKRELRILYNPEDEVWNQWDYYGEDIHTRKNRISFLIYPKDKFIINIDQIELSDIDFYLNSRVDRKHFLSMVPLLWGLRDWVIGEQIKEFHFIDLVMGRTGKSQTEVSEAVRWWKFKNQWKRSIRDDDPKALRMIERRLSK